MYFWAYSSVYSNFSDLFNQSENDELIKIIAVNQCRSKEFGQKCSNAFNFIWLVLNLAPNKPIGWVEIAALKLQLNPT